MGLFHKKIVVKGKVQGVGFRYATKIQAEKIKEIVGTVQNLSDGTVEIFVEGEEKKVDDLIAWCYRGSAMSEVSGVQILESRAIESFSFENFSIIGKGN